MTRLMLHVCSKQQLTRGSKHGIMPAGDAAIRKLNLTGNNIGDKGATLLAEMLKVGSRHPHVAHVNFPQVACHACMHSFITRLPIRRSGALLQTFYGKPPACQMACYACLHS